MNKKWLSVTSSTLAISWMMMGCTNVKEADKPSVSPDSAKQSQSVSANVSKTSVFKVEGIKMGDIVPPGDVKFKVLLADFSLSDYNAMKEAKPGEGHIHFWLDTDSNDPNKAIQVAKDPDNLILKDVKAGEHTLTVSLVGNDHKPITGVTPETIKFMVKAGAAAATTSANPASSTTSTIPAINNSAASSLTSPAPSPATKQINTGTNSANAASSMTNPQAAGTSTLTPAAGSTAASFRVELLKNGDIIKTEDLMFKVALTNLKLANYVNNKEPKLGEGHILLWLDTESREAKSALKVIQDADHVIIKHIKQGEHTIAVGLAGNDQAPIGNDVQTIKFTVKR